MQPDTANNNQLPASSPLGRQPAVDAQPPAAPAPAPTQATSQPQVAAPVAAPVPPGKKARPAKSKKKGGDPNSTQKILLVSELRENMVIMADGSFRAVVASKSINFDLMSEREREGVEYSYQGFLNSLNFPIQILIRSQRVDIAPYINLLETLRRSQDNILLGVLMDNYTDFIESLAEEANIMDKTFYVVIPYYPSGDVGSAVNASKNLFSSLFKSQQNSGKIKIGKEVYDKSKDEIQDRVSAVLNNLMQMGVRSVQLNTKELGELYYNFYNPDTAVRQRLGDFEKVTNTYISKGQGEAPQAHLRGV